MLSSSWALDENSCMWKKQNLIRMPIKGMLKGHFNTIFTYQTLNALLAFIWYSTIVSGISFTLFKTPENYIFIHSKNKSNSEMEHK